MDVFIPVLNILFSIVLMEFFVSFTRMWTASAFGDSWLTFSKITFLGTIHHELSHALFAILTGAKVEEMMLFNMDPESNTLGYVNIKFSRNKILGNIQKFFSAIAPLFTACVTVSILAKLLLPTWFNGEISGIISLFKAIQTWQFWIFILLAIPILCHANMSKADISICLRGIWFIIIALIVIALLWPAVIIALDIYISKLRNLTLLLLIIPVIFGLLVRLMSGHM